MCESVPAPSATSSPTAAASNPLKRPLEPPTTEPAGAPLVNAEASTSASAAAGPVDTQPEKKKRKRDKGDKESREGKKEKRSSRDKDGSKKDRSDKERKERKDKKERKERKEKKERSKDKSATGGEGGDKDKEKERRRKERKRRKREEKEAAKATVPSISAAAVTAGPLAGSVIDSSTQLVAAAPATTLPAAPNVEIPSPASTPTVVPALSAAPSTSAVTPNAPVIASESFSAAPVAAAASARTSPASTPASRSATAVGATASSAASGTSVSSDPATSALGLSSEGVSLTNPAGSRPAATPAASRATNSSAPHVPPPQLAYEYNPPAPARRRNPSRRAAETAVIATTAGTTSDSNPVGRRQSTASTSAAVAADSDGSSLSPAASPPPVVTTAAAAASTDTALMTALPSRGASGSSGAARSSSSTAALPAFSNPAASRPAVPYVDPYAQAYAEDQTPYTEPVHEPTGPMPVWAIGHDPSALLAQKWLNAAQLTELCKATGLAYKKGKFSTTEQAELHEALEGYKNERGITDEQLRGIVFAKGKKAREDNATFWAEITSKIQGRPIIAVYHHVRRIYHPMGKQGPWTKEQDEMLKAAVAEHGAAWEKVEQTIGRMAGDCRDRYRNHLEHGQGRHKGSWKPAEEETLTRLVLEAREKMAAANDNEKDSDVFWGEISKQMEYTRSRQQCRTKWQEQLERKEVSGEKAKWCKNDAFILVRKIVSLNAREESEIEWRLLPDEDWHNWPGHILKKRYLKLKKDVPGSDQMTYVELIQILSEQYAVPPAQMASYDYETTNEQYDAAVELVQNDAYAYDASAAADPSATVAVEPAAVPVPVELEPTELDAYGNPIDPDIMQPTPIPPPSPALPAPTATESVQEAMQRLEAQLGL